MKRSIPKHIGDPWNLQSNLRILAVCLLDVLTPYWRTANKLLFILGDESTINQYQFTSKKPLPPICCQDCQQLEKAPMGGDFLEIRKQICRFILEVLGISETLGKHTTYKALFADEMLLELFKKPASCPFFVSIPRKQFILSQTIAT